jgi:hypothetical protein
MKPFRLVAAALLAAAAPALAAERSAKEALQPFNHLIGSWRGTGEPEGSRQEKQRGFWTEAHAWAWQFKGGDAWLRVAIDKGKYFRQGELRYLPQKGQYQLTLTTPSQEVLTFTGPLEDRRLTLDRVDESKKQVQRVVLTLLHSNRFLYRFEVSPRDKVAFKKVYQVGATKEGEPFASGDGKPECIVSGGLGTIPVSYKGETYYVCCTGCRDEFREDPEKYVKEYEAKKKAK